LAKEFEKITVVLADADADWKLRTEGLSKLQRLIYGGATQYPSFITGLMGLREPLEIQVQNRCN
jgi:CLIP-associating protein 1/2